MVFKLGNILIWKCFVSILLVIQSSTSSPLENEKLIELTERFEGLQTKVKALEAENEKLTTRFGDLETENKNLKADVKELKVSKQDEELLLLKDKNSNLEFNLPSSWASSETNQSSNKNDNEQSTRGLDGLPSSCKELKDGYTLVPMNGIHLLRNKTKIKAVFCTFPTGKPVSEIFLGDLDIKTNSVHFYVQRNSQFKTNGAVIPFELARLNEGNAMDLASGIFTAPVPGIYHFAFSGLKDSFSTNLQITLQVNGIDVGNAYSDRFVKGTYDSVSLSASLRLKANDKVRLVHRGWLHDSFLHFTHFSGWLEEEDQTTTIIIHF